MRRWLRRWWYHAPAWKVYAVGIAALIVIDFVLLLILT